jgi:hypothetical protein
MKRSAFAVLLLGLVSLCFSSLSFAMGGPAATSNSSTSSSSGGEFSHGLPQPNNGNANLYVFDDFESGNYNSNPEWWVFDNVKPKVVSNSDYQTGDSTSLSDIKKYSLNVTGTCTDWYCGGMGVYTARKNTDLSKYNTFQMDVYGNGPGSGTIKVELFDDDNGNWQIEQDPKKNYAPMYDDEFVYNITVDWKGWKRVSIPIADFSDDNPGVGDDIWNPNQEGGSGGLIQMQLIFIGPKQSGKVNMNIDNVSLAVK